MKTNLPTSKFANLKGGAVMNKITFFHFLGFLLLLLFLLFCLLSCKSPAILTNADNHHSRDSNYHANYERIETHDTIVIGLPSEKSPFKGDLEGRPIIRISDRTRTIHDTTFLLRTDTLLRTQTITQTERYIPPFYKFCTIAFATLITLATLTFSIRLLFRYLKIRSPT